MKPKLLVVEFWGLGDLVIASPFIRAALEKYEVTLLAKPFAMEMRQRFWPGVEIVPFTAPWTAFRFGAKYGLWHWPWKTMLQLRRDLQGKHFDCAVSARWDPRDHWVLRTIGARERLGFPRWKSERFLTHPLPLPDPLAHRNEYWRGAGQALGLTLPTREKITPQARPTHSTVLIHSGARLPARIWPPAHFRKIAERLRKENFSVQIACDPEQVGWWQEQGENAVCPRNIQELLALVDHAGVFIGNCSGPGHLAAVCGVPTFTIYGPSLPEWWAPMHPAAEWIEGKACPYKPCADYCRYATPECLWKVPEEEVWARVQPFVRRHLSPRTAQTAN